MQWPDKIDTAKIKIESIALSDPAQAAIITTKNSDVFHLDFATKKISKLPISGNEVINCYASPKDREPVVIVLADNSRTIVSARSGKTLSTLADLTSNGHDSCNNGFYTALNFTNGYTVRDAWSGKTVGVANGHDGPWIARPILISGKRFLSATGDGQTRIYSLVEDSKVNWRVDWDIETLQSCPKAGTIYALGRKNFAAFDLKKRIKLADISVEENIASGHCGNASNLVTINSKTILTYDQTGKELSRTPLADPQTAAEITNNAPSQAAPAANSDGPPVDLNKIIGLRMVRKQQPYVAILHKNRVLIKTLSGKQGLREQAAILSDIDLSKARIIAFDPPAKRLLVRIDNKLKYFDWSKNTWSSINHRQANLSALSHTIVDLSGEHMAMLAYGDRSFRFLRFSKKSDRFNEIVGHQDAILKMRYSPSHKYLTTISRDKTLIEWKVNTGNLSQSFKHTLQYRPTAIAYEKNEKSIYFGTENGRVYIFNRAATAPVHWYPAHDDQILGILPLEELSAITTHSSRQITVKYLD